MMLYKCKYYQGFMPSGFGQDNIFYAFPIAYVKHMTPRSWPLLLTSSFRQE